MELTLACKDWFFDRKGLEAKVAKARVRALSKMGAYVQRKVKTRILRRRKASAPPGQPPSIHTESGALGLKTIIFAYDRSTDSVVVGPALLNQQQENWIEGGTIKVPGLMEFGGVVTIQERSVDGGRTWRRRDLRRNPRPGELFRRRRAIYKPHPFMGPGLLQTIPELPEACRNMLGPETAAVHGGA
jgi:hypothetical protein